jgi:predicted negative regulator of RcsB-dependent stress response
MAEELLTDQQQEEALRRWWSANWTWVIAGVVIGIAVLGGWQYWQQRKITHAEAAEQLYRDFSVALTAGDVTKAEDLLKNLEQQHGGSPYTDQSHLALASVDVNAGKYEQALSELKPVAAGATDKALRPIAQLRLARVQLQMGHHDEALAALDVNQAGAFVAQYQEVRGDALFAKGDMSGAKQAYQLALDAHTQAVAESPSNDDAALLRLKLQDIQLPAADIPAAPVSK